METETMKYHEDELEEGELSSSDEGYIPLKRPETQPPNAEKTSAMKPEQMSQCLEDIEDSPSDFDQSSDSSSGSDEGLKTATRATKTKQKKKRRNIVVKSKESVPYNQSRLKKYNIWSTSLQEESLMENMRGIGVAKYPKSDRSVESYDFSLKYRLNGESALKRKLSTSGDDGSDTAYQQQKKKTRKFSNNFTERRSIKSRIGSRESTSSCDSQNAPRYILDLSNGLESDAEEVAKEIANKLYEEKDELLLRVVDVIGKELSVEIFKETQRIERDGGMMIMNGMRRRTPGGVFLFLLKHHDKITDEDKKRIFREEDKKSSKERKILKAIKRDQKVEELKKRLCLKEKQLLPPLTRTENVSRLKLDNPSTLSNPPPSPVTNSGQDNSPDYSTHAINHVNDVSPEKPVSRNLNDHDESNLNTYNDDFLDMNYYDMDMS